MVILTLKPSQCFIFRIVYMYIDTYIHTLLPRVEVSYDYVLLVNLNAIVKVYSVDTYIYTIYYVYCDLYHQMPIILT